MSDEDIKILVEGWLNKVGQGRYDWGHVYNEGWENAIFAVMAELDDWLRKRGS